MGNFVNLNEFIRFVNKASNKDNEQLLKKIRAYLEKTTKKKIKNSQFKNGNTPLSSLTLNNRRGGGGGKPLMDNGGFLGSIKSAINSQEVAVGSKLIYSRLISEGGKIVPKKSKFLCIPANKEVAQMSKMGNGVKAICDDYKNQGYKIAWIVNSDKRVVLATKEKESIVLFYLKKSVIIPERNVFFLSDDDRKVINAMVENFLAGEK